MSGSRIPNMNQGCNPLTKSKRSRSCEEIYSSSGRQRCCCRCIGCACPGDEGSLTQVPSQPISVITPLILNAYGPIQVNSVGSNDSIPTYSPPGGADSLMQTHFIGAPSLKMLSQSHAHRNDNQIRQDTRDRFLEDPDDFNLHLFSEPDQMDDSGMTMPETQYPMELDGLTLSGKADRSSSSSMLSDYARSFIASLSTSGILVGAGTGAITHEREGNRYLELTERRRYPNGNCNGF